MKKFMKTKVAIMGTVIICIVGAFAAQGWCGGCCSRDNDRSSCSGRPDWDNVNRYDVEPNCGGGGGGGERRENYNDRSNSSSGSRDAAVDGRRTTTVRADSTGRERGRRYRRVTTVDFRSK
ncbi:MAG: hypothetical protein HQK53_14840 [Oligoflexia bacterium]|nr:hypothetical protein [Oligoflexia bacterium]